MNRNKDSHGPQAFALWELRDEGRRRGKKTTSERRKQLAGQLQSVMLYKKIQLTERDVWHSKLWDNFWHLKALKKKMRKAS